MTSPYTHPCNQYTGHPCPLQYEVGLTSVHALRTGFFHHIFCGDCVLHQGDECKTIVDGERWPLSMAIQVIDSTLQWVEKEVLSVDDFARICEALKIFSHAQKRKRSLMVKMRDRW